MSNAVYNKNMQALEERFDGLAYLIKEKKYSIDNKIDVECSLAEDGQKIIKVRLADRVLYLEGKYEPEKAIDKEIKKMEKVNYIAPIFVIGIGNALYIKKLLQMTKETVRITVYEPSLSIFLKVMEEIDITELFQNRAIGLIIEELNGEEKEEIINSFVTFSNISFLKRYIHPNYIELFKKEIVAFLTMIRKRINLLMIRENTIIRFSSNNVDNIFNNICYLCDNYQAYQLASIVPIDMPAIIVSAGPSLNKNINELKRAKNKAFIVAVDTAVKPLLNAGIKPDIIVTVDAKKPVNLFEMEGVEQIPLLLSISSSKEVANYHKGKKFFFCEYEGYIDRIFEELQIPFYHVETGGSVSTNALSFVYKLGYSVIILVGQDLAMTDNKTHADGTFKEHMNEIDTSRLKKVEGYYGEEVPTRPDFYFYLQWFNDFCKRAKDVCIINATEGGARIQNTEMISLKETIDKYCTREINMDEIWGKLEPVFQKKDRERAIKYLHDTPNDLLEMKRHAQQGKRLYQKLNKMSKQGCKDRKAYEKILKKIQKNRDTLEGNVKLWGIIAQTIAVPEYIIRSEAYYEEENFELENQRIAYQGRKIMEYIIKCIDLLIPVAEETVGKVQ